MRIICLFGFALYVFAVNSVVLCGVSNADTKGFVSCKEGVVYKEEPHFAGDRVLLGKLSNNTVVSISNDSNGAYLVNGGGLHGYVEMYCVTLSKPPTQEGEDSANRQHAQQQTIQDTPNKAVSAEFAKAANAALVAIKNSETQGDTPDQTVVAAVNEADAAAVSDSETAVLREIKVLSSERPMLLALLYLSADAPAGSPVRDQWSKEMGDLQREYDCIAAWRLTLRNLSGNKPQECEIEKPR
jgi:hypothetical protein